MTDLPIYKQLSQKLYDLFFVDEFKYGRQLDNGNYRLIKEKVSPVTIDDMLLNQKSLLTYQESHTLQTAYIKWVCLDIDIDISRLSAKQKTAPDESRVINIEDLKNVKKAADDISDYLCELNISHLVEFSGGRGFHIWVIFDSLISKQEGFKFIKLITTKINLEESINIDLFPKTGYISKNSKGIGSGVKLPLSTHKRSGYLSHFVKDGSFEFDKTKWRMQPDEAFFKSQLVILQNFELMKFENIIPLLSEYDSLPQGNKAVQPFLTKTLFKMGGLATDLDIVLDSLKKCGRLRETINNYRKGLNPKERTMMVGLLAQLTTIENPNFGKDLLMEFFSRVSGYRKDLTQQKLKLAKYYYPISCESLGRCDVCTCNSIKSPIELIEGLTILPKPLFNIDNISDSIFDKIVSSQIKYCKTNDEIPLYNHLVKLENTKFDEVHQLVNNIFNGKFPAVLETFRFERNEIDKKRNLYTVDHLNDIVSTYFLFVLNNIYYSEISPNSYGYRIAPGFYNSNIFSNWFINWGSFSKQIQTIIESEEYRDYYLVKLDIKNFYDRIDLQRLEVKLYEESPETIDKRIKSLSDDERTKYLNIIKYFIYLSKETTGNVTKGLPQGPAYARYLAEIYLLGLDKLIERDIIKDKKREYYLRFVDDIFIFVENKEKAVSVLKQVQNWISGNSLELNPQKTELTSVKEYSLSGKFKKFQDDAKYAINKSNKNKELLSEEERQEVISKVEQLTNDTKFGLKDNLRFFYYQFSGDQRLEHVRSKISEILPFSDNGRGTLFMLLYTDLFENQNAFFWTLATQQARLTGLSLGHYLNTILLNFEKALDKRDLISDLVNALSKREDLSYADLSLALTLTMKFNIPIQPILLNKCSKTLTYSVMQTPNLEYTEANYSLLEQMLQSKQEVDFISAVYNVILNHPMSTIVAQKLAMYSFTRFSEWEFREEIKDKIKVPAIALEYYHCICFLTLFDKSIEPKSVQTAWKLLLSLSKDINLLGEKISFGWINNAINIFPGELSSSAFGLLIANKGGSELNKISCQNHFMPQFIDILAIFYFTKSKLTESHFDQSKDLIDKDTFFGKWLVDKKTNLYPVDDNLCVKNLALNGLVVLHNDKEIFLKNINGNIGTDRFSYLSASQKKDKSELVLKKTKSLGAPIFEKAKNFIEIIVLLGKQIDNDISFKDTFEVEYPVYYDFPYLIEGKPLIPYYSMFNQKVSTNGIIQANDVHTYWENLISIAFNNNLDCKLILEDNPFNFKLKDILERFIPQSEMFIKNDQDKLDFVRNFAKEIEKIKIQTIFDFQYYWSKVIWQTVSEQSKTSTTDFIVFLHIHFSTFKKGALGALDILFGVDHLTVTNDDNLADFFQTIRNSLITFQNQVSLRDFDLVEIFDNEVKLYIDVLPQGLNLKDFKKTKINLTSRFNAVKNITENEPFLDKDNVADNQLMIYDRKHLAFYSKTFNELNNTLNSRQYFVAQQDKVLHLFPIEFEISNAYNRVIERKQTLKDAESDSSNYIKLFPGNKSYDTAERAFKQYRARKIEEILKNHYIETTKIDERVIQWLTLFNEVSIKNSKTERFLIKENIGLKELYWSILDVLSNHIAVEDDDIAHFTKHMKEEIDNGSYIFAVKDPRNDDNGLARLLIKAGLKNRIVDFEQYHAAMIDGDLEGKTLVIAADITISGGQIKTALDYYSTTFSSEEQFKTKNKTLLENNERYFKFSNREEFNICKNNFSKAKEIKIVTPISTDALASKIKDHKIFGKNIPTIISNKSLSNFEYNMSMAKIDEDNRKLFKVLMQDYKLIEKIFKLKSIGDYQTKIRGVDHNVVLRVGSLPKHHIPLFSAKSKNGGFSLLDYIPNWKKLNYN